MPNTTFSNTVTIADILMRRNELNNLSDTPRLDIEIILAHVLEVDRTYLYVWPNFCLSDIQQSKFNQLFADRLLGKPIAYITEVREFWSLPLKVSTATIIPRPETEEIVGWILDDFKNINNKLRIIDMGTGSGCIGISLAKEQSFFSVFALDKDKDILDLTAENAKINGVRIKCIKKDIFKIKSFQLKIDVIVRVTADCPVISSEISEILLKI